MEQFIVCVGPINLSSVRSSEGERHPLEEQRIFSQVLESQRTMTQGDQGQEKRRTFSQVLKS
jgi:hypothetical protein